MVYYVKNGEIPEKRHTYISKDKIYKEELFGLDAFDGRYSLLYHLYDPAEIESFEKENIKTPDIINSEEHRHIKAGMIETSGNFITGRKILFTSGDISTGVINIKDNTDEYFRNALCDEVFYIQDGSGKIETAFGTLNYSEGDFIYIPKGTTYKMNINEKLYAFFVTSTEHIDLPLKYLNKYGQLKEGVPFYTRDIIIPEFKEPESGNGNYKIKVYYGNYYINYERKKPVFDLAGYDGYLYPFTINIDKIAPIVGKLHMPPPVHGIFESKHFMVGAFLPRPFDFDEKSIPVPYAHNNIDSDELIFYSSGNFMSRKGIGEKSITMHVHGLIHGPQPGIIEKSIGAKSTDEVAIMVESYKWLQATSIAEELKDKNYMYSWKN